MAFPTLVGTATWESSGSVANHYAAMPAGVQAGDLVMVLHNKLDAGAGTIQSEWTRHTFATDQNELIELLWAIADGAWTGNRLTNALSGSRTGSSITYVWRDLGPAQFEVSAILSQGAAQPNPPAFSPSWGAGDTTWIAHASWSVRLTTVTTYPAGYGSGIEAAPSSGTSHQASARRNLAAASEDPGAFALSGTLTGIYSMTIAVQGISAPAAKPRFQVISA